MASRVINAAVVDKDYQSAAVFLAQMWEKGTGLVAAREVKDWEREEPRGITFLLE